jgi:hypothetical protein
MVLQAILRAREAFATPLPRCHAVAGLSLGFWSNREAIGGEFLLDYGMPTCRYRNCADASRTLLIAPAVTGLPGQFRFGVAV